MTIRIAKGEERYNTTLAFLLNFSMLMQMLSSFCIGAFGTEFSIQSTINKLILALLFLNCLLILLKRETVLLSIMSFIWLTLHIIAYFYVPRMLIFATRIVIYSYGYVIIVACMLASLRDIHSFLSKMKPYVIISLLYCPIQILEYQTTGLYSMAFSYNTVLSAILCIVYGREKKGYYFAFLVILLTDIYCGSRGCLICFALAVILNEVMFGKRGIKLLSIFIIIIGAAILFTKISAISYWLLQYLPNSRTLSYLAKGDVINLTGRDHYYSLLLSKAYQSNFAVHGLYSDRFVMAANHGRKTMEDIYGSYAHNLFVEVIYQFGWIAFPLIIFFLFKIISSFFKVLKIADRSLKVFWLLIVSYSIGQLMISSSYLTAVSFGELIGLIILTDRFYQNKSKKLATTH